MTTENVELQAMLGKLLTAGDGDFCRQAPKPARYRCNPRLAPSSLSAC